MENHKFTATIVVSSDANDPHRRTGFMDLGQGIRKQGLHGRRRLGAIVHVTRQKKHIGLFLTHQRHHLVEHGKLLFPTVIVIQHMTQMPVAGVQDLHQRIS